MIGTINLPWDRDQTVALRDGILEGPVPGNKLPGYDHGAPPGLGSAMRLFQSQISICIPGLTKSKRQIS